MNKKKLKRREEKEQNNLYKKGKTEKIIAGRISEAAMGGAKGPHIS
jgi:hypothetical protein